MNPREGLGFKHLSYQEQQAYKVLLKAFSLQAASFDCTKIGKNVDVIKVMHTVLGDNPSIIYFDKALIQIQESSFGKKVILTGVHLKPQAMQMNEALDVKANKIVSSLKAESSNEYSLLMNLYNSLQRNIKYDNEEFHATLEGISKSPASHTAYGAIVNRVAVCDGFSLAFVLLAQKLGFECMLAFGQSAYSSMSVVEHAWNIIKIKDKFYHMDITWDTLKYNGFGEYSYDYFALRDEEISNDHKWVKETTPACKYNDLSYYLKNGLYANNVDQLSEIIKACTKNGEKVFRIQLAHNVTLPKNAGEYLAQKVMNEGVKLTGHIQASYGWNENVRCFFAKITN